MQMRRWRVARFAGIDDQDPPAGPPQHQCRGQPSRSATDLTRCAVAAFTRPGRENVRETVDGATPAARATS